MAGRLGGKSALVTGGASGIGAAIARLFSREAARVLVCDVQEQMAARVAEDIRKEGGDAVSFRLDVSSEDSWRRAVDAVGERFGGLTTLVNCAGITRDQGLDGEDVAGWDRTIAVNQTSVFLGMKLCMPTLVRSTNGSVVNISSVYGLIGSPTSFSYHASKAAVRVMSKSAALEYARKGVRINTIFPGLIHTPILKGLTEAQLELVAKGSAMGRIGQPEDIAHGALYLASDDANYVSGAELIIDGAWLAGHSV
ncbi:MAG: SDR family NAD(P)-dependent oxidoreductase [Sphingomonadaceae bacterium]